MATAVLSFPVAGLDAIAPPSVPTAVAPIVKIDGTNRGYLARAFDDAGSEYCAGMFTVPTDIDGSGTVTFRVTGKRATGTGAANVVLAMFDVPLADSEAEDVLGGAVPSSGHTLAVDTTAGDVDIDSWTETATNLTWTAGETVEFYLFRDGANGSDTLSGDWWWRLFTIEIPLA